MFSPVTLSMTPGVNSDFGTWPPLVVTSRNPCGGT